MSLELNKKQKNHSLAMALLKGRTLIVLALLVVFFSFASPNFLTANTMLLLAKHVALYGITSSSRAASTFPSARSSALAA